jgi:uncharacterized membrane protein YvlD (DUF360 family)
LFSDLLPLINAVQRDGVQRGFGAAAVGALVAAVVAAIIKPVRRVSS